MVLSWDAENRNVRQPSVKRQSDFGRFSRILLSQIGNYTRGCHTARATAPRRYQRPRRTGRRVGGHPPGVVFARALLAYLDGGPGDRQERKLDRVLEDATAMLKEMNPDDDAGGLSVVERRTIAIGNRLPEEFPDDDHLVETIADVAGSSEPTIEKYRERVVDRLGVEPHPNAQSSGCRPRWRLTSRPRGTLALSSPHRM